MKLLIAGASGFIGKALCQSLTGHEVVVLGRNKTLLQQTFPGCLDQITWDNLKNYQGGPFDVVINLAGSNIGAKRWTPEIKKELIESRTTTNALLIQWLIETQQSPHFLCANAVGAYGAHEDGSEILDEDSLNNKTSSQDFLQEITRAWEASLQPARDVGMKVTVLRFGVVLKKHEGMLKKLELPFQMGLGSTLGEGRQYLFWIHYQDLIQAILFLINHPEVTGAINLTAPHPVSQNEFAKTFAKVLKRPLFLKMPAFIVQALFGEMGEYLLLKGQRVVPKRLQALDFQFQYPDLIDALEKEYPGKSN